MGYGGKKPSFGSEIWPQGGAAGQILGEAGRVRERNARKSTSGNPGQLTPSGKICTTKQVPSRSAHARHPSISTTRCTSDAQMGHASWRATAHTLLCYVTRNFLEQHSVLLMRTWDMFLLRDAAMASRVSRRGWTLGRRLRNSWPLGPDGKLALSSKLYLPGGRIDSNVSITPGRHTFHLGNMSRGEKTFMPQVVHALLGRDSPKTIDVSQWQAPWRTCQQSQSQRSGLARHAGREQHYGIHRKSEDGQYTHRVIPPLYGDTLAHPCSGRDTPVQLLEGPPAC
eukprot:1141063-Pelagomonas_calceolata.AAC.4